MKALDGANLYAYPEHETGDVMLESDNDDQDMEEDGRLVDEWQENTNKSTEDMTETLDATKPDENPLQYSFLITLLYTVIV